MFPCQLREVIERDARRPAHRFVLVPNDRRQSLKKLVLADQNFMMMRADMLRDYSCVRQFAKALFCVPDRESLNWLSAMPGGQSRDSARIKSAAQKDAERDIAH